MAKFLRVSYDEGSEWRYVIDRPLITPDSNGFHGLAAVLADDPMVLGATSETLPDGGALVTLGEEEEPSLTEVLANLPFDANLAEHLPEHTLQAIATELRNAHDDDKNSRGDWEDALAKGMDLLGIKIEDRSEPWKGACGVVQPMILEAAVRFQSKAINRLFPPEGPANAKIVGATDEAKLAAAKRVTADMNRWLTELMPEYRDETDQLLFALPVDGSAFKKVFYDPLLERPVAQFVPANDFIMPYGFPNLETCPRYTHVMKKAAQDVLILQERGFFRNIPLVRAPIQVDTVEQKVIQTAGVEPSYTRTDLITLWESHVNLAIENDPLQTSPYVVTLEYDSQRVLAIYRNWREGDPRRSKILSFTHYRYVPWKGAYGLGLIHLIGGITKGTTSILRQLVDAGTLANLPGGLKSKQLRIKGENDPIRPGEWRDVDVPPGKLADSLYNLPYKEPSTVLFQLMEKLVEQGKSFASIAELDLTSSTQNAPVGTMLALIERATEVVAAVYQRVHTALGRELALVAEIIRDFTPQAYDYEPEGNVPREIKTSDYAQLLTITPVSDPAASTMAQRVMVYQSALQLSSQAPQLYNLPLLHRSMLEVLGVDHVNEIVPDKTHVEPMDPVSENMALLTSKPVKAFEWQDHKAHIAVHMSLAQDPKLKQALEQNPLAPSIMSAGAAHIAEHLAFEYRKEMEKQMGVPLPPIDAKLPPEVEHELSALLAQAAGKVLAQNQSEMQAKQNEEAQQDPVVQLQKAELQIKAQTQQAKAEADQAKLRLEAARLLQKSQVDQADIASKERIAAAEIEGENQRVGITEQAETLRRLNDNALEQERLASEERQAAQQPPVPPQ